MNRHHALLRVGTSFASRAALLSLMLLGPFAARADSDQRPILASLDSIYRDLDTLYIDLHQTPELSRHEEKTAAKMAARLRKLGFEVTTGIGGTGVVGVLRNGSGPTVMLRTELDALPMEEKTGLPFASKVLAKNDAGLAVPVMHACGHDIHMTSWVGAAILLAQSKDRWRGTLVMVGQPAEELVSGAAAMIADGLFSRFPKPDFAVAVHDIGYLPSGQVGVVPGYALANVNTVEVTFYGKGGHGSTPHATVDPIVMAARSVVAFQTIVAREVNPIEPAVVTVGSFHGGTKSNIIPDEAKLQITVRSYNDEVQKQLLAAIARIAKGEAIAAGAPRDPLVWVDPESSARATFNDEALTKRLSGALARTLGESNVVPYPRVMGSEDFSEYGRAGVPATLFWIGATAPAKFAEAKAKGVLPPNNHSSIYAPDRERTIRTGVSTLTVSALDLFGKAEAAVTTK
jgi:amidohydrolase